MKKNTKKALAGLTLAASALSVNAAADEFVLGEYTLSAAEAHRAEYTKIANVQGSFRFTQDVLSTSEDVFNLYGTAVTGMCAKPAFAFEAGEEDVGRHYINVSGSMKHDYSVTVNDLRAHTRTRVAACSCATGKAVTQVQISGIPVSSILSLAELQEGVNRMLKGRTSFIVAHRLSTIRACNKIMYIDHGEIAECGTHEELLARKGLYWQLCQEM